MHHLHARQLQKPRAGKVRALANARRAVVELVRVGLQGCDQIADRFDARRGVRRDDVGNPDHVGDALQLLRLVGQVAEDAEGDRVRTGIADQDSLAVAFAADDFGRTDRAAAA